MRTRAAVAAAILLLCHAGAQALPACEGLKVEDGWIPQAPPVATVMAGYARLSNGGDRPLHVDAVKGADFGSVELHQMSMQNGMMQMRPLRGLDLPAHGSVELAEGGKHLMLLNPRHPLQPGDNVTLEFHCGKQVTPAQFAVRPAPQ
ncbi:MAG: copper chaperone PCu(A)C [Nevskia sp.]|nr:copper chaperone PCu(A)C [Nevskia sp.]